MKQIRQFITICLVAVTFLLGSAFGYGYELQAQANTITPEANSYQFDQNKSNQLSRQASENSKELIGNSQEQLKGAADNVREKLNVDESLPPSTKNFINQVQDKIDDVINPS